MPNTATRIYGPAQLSNSAATLYTVPSLTLAKVRWIHVSNPGAATAFTLSIGADSAATRLYDAYPLPGGAAFDFYPYAPVSAAEVIQGFAAVGSQVVIVIEADLCTLG